MNNKATDIRNQIKIQVTNNNKVKVHKNKVANDGEGVGLTELESIEEEHQGKQSQQDQFQRRA